MTETILYFAYGSNMLSHRLQERTPSARAVAIGRICGHRLCWHKVSRDGSGKCDADASENPDDCVWGVIYRLGAHEKPALDIAEGLGSGYATKTVHVTTSQGVMVAVTYVATLKDAALLPFDWYKALVLAGAREHGLPPGYVLTLQEVKSAPDPDLKRVAQNEAVLYAAHSRIPALDDPLKPLTEVIEPDSRQAFFVGSLAERHAELAALALHYGVPRDVRQLFETAKNVSLYSWYVYPFNQVAELVAFAALEMALREKFDSERQHSPERKRPPMLRELLRLAHERRWLRDGGFEMLPALAARRIRDRHITEAIANLKDSPGIGQLAVSEEVPSATEIQAEIEEMRFVENLWRTVPDVRNLLAHGSAVLHPNSHYTLHVVSQAINQLFALGAATHEGSVSPPPS